MEYEPDDFELRDNYGNLRRHSRQSHLSPGTLTKLKSRYLRERKKKERARARVLKERIHNPESRATDTDFGS